MKGNGSKRVLALALGLGLGGASAAWAANTKVITVDCDRGDSINQALTDKTERLVIEVRGLCHEKVVIQRSGVVLHGLDPALDGIAGPASGPADEFLVTIWGADVSSSILAVPESEFAVEIQNLGLRDGDGGGLAAWSSLVQVEGSSIEGNGGPGLYLSGASAALVVDTLLADNEGDGATVNRSSTLICDQCTVEDNEGLGLRALNGGNISAFDSAVVGEFGVGAANDAVVTANALTVTTTNLAFWFTGARLTCADSQFDGALRLNKGGYARFLGCDQTSNGGVNLIAEDTSLEVVGGSLAGLTRLDRFSSGSLGGGAVVADLECQSGADLVCDGSETKLSSTCGLCP